MLVAARRTTHQPSRPHIDAGRVGADSHHPDGCQADAGASSVIKKQVIHDPARGIARASQRAAADAAAAAAASPRALERADAATNSACEAEQAAIHAAHRCFEGESAASGRADRHDTRQALDSRG